LFSFYSFYHVLGPKIRESIDRIIGDFSKIDVLVNNAGIMQTKSIFEIEEEDWDRVLNVNLKAMFFLSQAVGQHMGLKSIKMEG
jgi:NAD(P)-dependent dehydrogenase (short-subunit alcohol dehydrogenase family)